MGGALQFGYGLALFLTSAGALVVEIAAGRMLAPYVGMSLYTWTAVIAVVLAGLSIGHWIGGRLAAAHILPGRALNGVALALLLAGFTAGGAAPLLRLLAVALSETNTAPLGLIILLSGSVFFLPSLFVGVVSPVLTKLAIDAAPDRQGPVIGRMFALGAAGSILGTLAAGYVFISWIGTGGTMLAVAVLYLLLAIAFWRQARRMMVAGLLCGIVLLAGWGLARHPAFAAPCLEETDYYCIRIVDYTAQSGRPSSLLVLDHLAHSINDRDDPGYLHSPYLHFIAARSERLLQGRAPRAFFVGGGAYTLPRAWAHRFPNAELTVAEIDPRVTAMAANRMGLDAAAPALRIRHQDARRALAATPERFDLILGDAFHDYAIPAHLVTREFHRLVRSRLAPDGFYAINVIDQSEDPRFTFALARTIRADFPVVEVWLDDDSRRRGGRVTFVVMGLEAPTPVPAFQLDRAVSGRWLRWPEEDLFSRIAAADSPVLTDDYAPVDRLMAGFVLRPDEALR